MIRIGGLAALGSILVTMPAAGEVSVCGIAVKSEKFVFERAAKWFGSDRKQKKALGSFIVDCESDGAKWIVSSPDGTATHPQIVAYRYR
ncbi:hypothetical protein [Pinisolibacter sp.]|uniref:hypothetical protein n=1 Tax=Pinisolibacter sp. TaxID=2172024 RepID=UPI002FDED268